jgi:hypothetical protein
MAMNDACGCRVFCAARIVVMAALFLAALAGCAGYRKTIEKTYLHTQAGNFEEAIETIEDSGLGGSGKNRLFYLMEKGVLLHLNGEYRQSNDVLEEADQLAEELFTRSLSAESLSFILNDTFIPYAGEDYESVALNYYKALNYIALDELDEALVECRRVDEKLNYFTDTYDARNVFKESAFLRFLSGLIYEEQDDPNNAFIAYRKSLDAYRTYKDRYGVAVPKALWGRLLLAARRMGFMDEYRKYQAQARAEGLEPAEAASLVAVIVNEGFAPVKKEHFILVPSQHGFPVTLVVPEFESRPSRSGRVEVSIDGKEWMPAEIVEDVDAVARQSLADKKLRLIAKAVVRAAAKQVAAWQADKEYGAWAGIAAQLIALLTERADLRSWTSLPGKVRLALVPADPGWHTVVIRFESHQEMYWVKVKDNSVGFVTTRAF